MLTTEALIADKRQRKRSPPNNQGISKKAGYNASSGKPGGRMTKPEFIRPLVIFLNYVVAPLPLLFLTQLVAASAPAH